MPPVLETDRLLLRAHTAADFDAACRLWGHPEVTRFIGGRPSTPEEVWSRLMRYAGHWQFLGYGYFAVVEKASDTLIGDIGLADFHRTIDPPLTHPEAGWVLHPDHHGKSYATEALATLLAWSDPTLPTTCCLIRPDNTPSVRLAKKSGYVQQGEVEYAGHTSLLLERTALPG